MPVNLAKLPSAPKEYQVTLGSLYGGLNTSRLPHEISKNQLSDCLNVYWKDGMVRSRKGQNALEHTGDTEWHLQDDVHTEQVTPLTMYDRVWHDRLFMAFCETENEVGYIASYNVATKQYERIYKIEESGEQLVDWSKESRGAFFEFQEKLYYKNRHLYLEITYAVNESTGTETITAVPVIPYTPITQINTGKDGIGDLYQPENRLSQKKEIWYNADKAIDYAEIECDGKTKVFHLPEKGATQPQDGDLRAVLEVYIGAAKGVEGTDYSVDIVNGTVTTLAADAPGIGLKLTVKMQFYSFVYRLPVDVDSVESVYVKDLSVGYVLANEVAMAPRWDPVQHVYEYIVVGGNSLMFGNNAVIAPESYDANVLNSFIKVTYSKKNEAAFDSIDECNIAAVFGATGIETNCIVMSGCSAQPNAIFWSGNDSNGANPAYFPMTHYNLAGEASDPITAFGRQQNKLVIFQTRRVSAADFNYATVDGRLNVSMNIRSINDRIGCDLPQSVQLCNNNLVWAHSRYGVLYLKDSTYAYETLIAVISENVNDGSKVVESDGLLRRLRDNRYDVCSADDGDRYWLTIGNYTYVWDYATQPYTSNAQKLCWWLMDNINAAAWSVEADNMYILSRTNIREYGVGYRSDCWISTFSDSKYLDFVNQNISRSIQIQSQTFGTFDRMKNVLRMIVSVSSDTRSHARVTYITDYENREDLTEINTEPRHPRGSIKVPDSIHVRKPKCLHVHTFAVRFDTDSAYDLNLITCQIFYNYHSRIKAGIRI